MLYKPLGLTPSLRREVTLADVIELHPEARRHFSEQAAAIQRALVAAPSWRPGRPWTGSRAHLPLKDGIDLGTDTIDGTWIEGLTDPLLGRYVTLEIHSPEYHRGLFGEGMTAFNRLVDQVSRQREVHRWCSLKYVETELIHWLEAAQYGDVPSWGDALVAAMRRDVKSRRVLVPIQGIEIEQDIVFGVVRIGYFTASYFEEKVYRPMREKGATDEDVDRFRHNLERYEGVVYGSVKCIAEPGRAAEIALEAVDQLVALLRFLHPAALDARIHCTLGRMGSLRANEDHVIIERDVIVESINDAVRQPPFDLDLSDDEAQQALGPNLALLNHVVSLREKNDLQTRVLAAMVLFSNGLVFEGVEHRLLHALVSVESMLLKNANEAISASVAPRMAHLIGRSLEERRAIVEDFRSAYGVRSGFVHHGEAPSPEEIELVNRVIQHCWTALLVMLGGGEAWTTKDEMVRALDDRVLS